MLYVIYRANHPSLEYRGGQGPIVHLEADLRDVVAWAEAIGSLWAFSLSNAGANYTEFRCDLAQLDEIDWKAVANNDFRSQDVKEAKQAEFLLYGEFPWPLVNRIGVINQAMKTQAQAALAEAAHRPPVEVQRSWYY